MLLKAIHTVVGDETYKPGDVFLMSNNVQALRLIETGAAVPVRKKITLSFSSKSDTDGMAKDVMDERRQSESDKTVINYGCDAAVSKGEETVSEGDDQHRIGSGVFGLLDARVQSESDQVLTHVDHTISPKRRHSLSASEVEKHVKNHVEKESSLTPDLEGLGN